MDNVKNWIRLARLPFYNSAFFPFVLGIIIAARIEKSFSLPILIASLIGVFFILVATHYAGEYYDFEVDALSAKLEKNKFSGGSQILQEKPLPKKYVFWGSIAAFILAALTGLFIRYFLKSGPLTIWLGTIGVFCGFFYSTPPFNWVKRGVGEIIIGFAYGWLTVASAFYLMSGKIIPMITWISLPIALTIFNVILINEFPDYPADKKCGKKTLVVRFGKKVSSRVYAAAAFLEWILFIFSVFKFGLSQWALVFYAPVFAAGLYLFLSMLRGEYIDKKKLEKMCGMTIMVNLGTSLAYILVFLF